MDPVTGAIVAAVLFWFLKELVAVVIFWGCLILGGLIGGPVGIHIGGLIGVFGAVGWTVFAIVTTIAQIIQIVQLVAA